MEQQKTFSAWIIPGIVIPPYLITRSPKESYEDILNSIADRYELSVFQIMKRVKGQKNNTGELTYARHIFTYFMRDVYKKDAPYEWLATLIDSDHSSAVKSIPLFKLRLDQRQLLPKRLSKIADNVKQDYIELSQTLRQWI